MEKPALRRLFRARRAEQARKSPAARYDVTRRLRSHTGQWCACTLRLPILGSNVPIMGMNSRGRERKGSQSVGEASPRYAVASGPDSGLADALFTTTQQRVLGALFGHPQRNFTVSELIASTGAGSGAVQRELAKLESAGLLTMQPVGNQKRYQANASATIHTELVAIMQKTVALAEPLREALVPISARIHAAFVFGSVAKHSDAASSDIDLMVISDTLSYAEVMGVLHPAMERLHREINPTIYTATELAERRASNNPFVTNVMQHQKIWLIGNARDLGD